MDLQATHGMTVLTWKNNQRLLVHDVTRTMLHSTIQYLAECLTSYSHRIHQTAFVHQLWVVE